MARTAKPKQPADAAPITLKVTLQDVHPPVWRRLLVPATITLGDLHDAIQAAMGWEDSHLHAFNAGSQRYGRRGTLEDVADESRVRLNSLLKSGIDRFKYTYDFGDDWEHLIVVENPKPGLEGSSYPLCVAGKGNCPPEDCGGFPGYERLLEILADRAHPEHAETVEWIGQEFDPEEFDIDNVNAALAARFRRK
jgi:hypothetical protein